MRTCAQAEESVLRQVITEDPQEEEIREALESLLDGLLATLGHPGPGSTDGLAISRQGVSRSSLWALGTAFMFGQPDQEPVWIELTYDPAGHAMTAGQVLLGIRDSALLGIRRSKLETKLLGFPHETKGTVPWRHAFTREPSGWRPFEWESQV